MKISYAIPVCNEHTELEKLLKFLIQNKRPEDEIIVQVDSINKTPEVEKLTNEWADREDIKLVYFEFNGNFADLKNNLKNQCTGDYIFQIDADETPHEYLINLLPVLFQHNPDVDLFLVPRINIVNGLTQEHIQKWGWRVNEKGWVNFPDSQMRILRNTPQIQWASKVHEIIVGYKTYVSLPLEEQYTLYHEKSIARQELQNEFYSTL
jgi:glycosyltransferase involved in cell wall biosynthesis